MNVNQLRPHIQSRIAHELGITFLDNLDFAVKNKLQEKDVFVTSIYTNEEIAKQESPKYEPGILMDGLLEAASDSGHHAIVKDTKPKGHIFVQMVTKSCHMVITRRNTTNTHNAKFYIEEALHNVGLLKVDQKDLFDSEILGTSENIDDLLFVCVTAYWDTDNELLDLSFIIPSPNEKRSLMTFSLNELKQSSLEPMTEVAEEPILALKKRLDDASDDHRDDAV